MNKEIMKKNNKKRKIEPAISQHFSKLAQKSWKIRKEKILAKAKVGNNKK